jgi:hypothetical protein
MAFAPLGDIEFAAITRKSVFRCEQQVPENASSARGWEIATFMAFRPLEHIAFAISGPKEDVGRATAFWSSSAPLPVIWLGVIWVGLI